MSFDINGTQAFIDVFQSGLISPQEFEVFYQQTSDLQQENEIEQAIGKWLKAESREHILQAYKEQLIVLNASSPIDLNQNLGGFGTKSATKPNEPSQTSRELLDNAIQKPSSSSTSQPSKP